MFVYINGKIIKLLDSKIIIKLPNGQGYLLNVSFNEKYNLNENIELFVCSYFNSQNGQGEFYAFSDFESWQLATTMINCDIEIKFVAPIIWDIGVPRLHQSILQKDESYLKKLGNIPVKTITKVLGIDLNLLSLTKNYTNTMSRADSNLNGEIKKENYSPAEFTQRLSSLGYARSRIVEIISHLKKEDLWGKMPLIDLVKKSLELMEQK